MTERFVSTRINNRLGCNPALQPYKCCEFPQTFQTVEYAYQNPNYDLIRETHDWGADQFQPSLLLPQLRRYKKLSGRDDCYVNTMNQRSTLYNEECSDYILDKTRYSDLIGEGTQELAFDNNEDGMPSYDSIELRKYNS